jgi:hypothetical protein
MENSIFRNSYDNIWAQFKESLNRKLKEYCTTNFRAGNLSRVTFTSHEFSDRESDINSDGSLFKITFTIKEAPSCVFLMYCSIGLEKGNRYLFNGQLFVAYQLFENENPVCGSIEVNSIYSELTKPNKLVLNVNDPDDFQGIGRVADTINFVCNKNTKDVAKAKYLLDINLNSIEYHSPRELKKMMKYTIKQRTKIRKIIAKNNKIILDKYLAVIKSNDCMDALVNDPNGSGGKSPITLILNSEVIDNFEDNKNVLGYQVVNNSGQHNRYSITVYPAAPLNDPTTGKAFTGVQISEIFKEQLNKLINEINKLDEKINAEFYYPKDVLSEHQVSHRKMKHCGKLIPNIVFNYQGENYNLRSFVCS